MPPSAEPVYLPIEETKTSGAPPPDPGCKRDAVVFVLDKSGSMMGTPFEQAKKGAKRIFGKLGKDDCFSLIAFDSKPGRVVKLAPGGDREKIDAAIDGLAPGGGTEIFSALDMAFEDLKAAKTAKRRMILFLTDGQAPSNGIKDLASYMAAENITVSAIGLGSGIDEWLLRMVADTTKGRLRKVTAPADLPKILEEELTSMRR